MRFSVKISSSTNSLVHQVQYYKVEIGNCETHSYVTTAIYTLEIESSASGKNP